MVKFHPDLFHKQGTEETHATRTLSSTSRNDGANSAAIGINGQISIPAARFGATRRDRVAGRRGMAQQGHRRSCGAVTSDRRQVASSLRGKRPQRVVRRAATRCAPIDLGRTSGRGGIQDTEDQAGGQNPVDGALHGRGDRPDQGRGPSHLAHIRLTAAPDPEFQAVH